MSIGNALKLFHKATVFVDDFGHLTLLEMLSIEWNTGNVTWLQSEKLTSLVLTFAITQSEIPHDDVRLNGYICVRFCTIGRFQVTHKYNWQ